MKKAKYEVRIRYDEDWNGQGEHFVFEGKWTFGTEWELDTAFKLIDNMISYQALTKIRQLKKLGIDFYFA